MEYAGFNASEVARQLDWSPGRVSRLLAGKRGGSGYDVSAFLAVCGVKGEERERLIALSLDHDKPGWFQQHGPVVPKQVRTLIDYETKTRSITDFQSTLVHGLLQTGGYAREVITHGVNVPRNEIEDRVTARLARQVVLSRENPPRCLFYLHEFVLRTPVGGPRVMSDQLHNLLRMSVRPFLSLRVLPIEVGAHAAMSGPFTLMDIPGFKPVVYLDSENASLFLETPAQIDGYRNVLTALEDTALDEGQSRELISSVALEFKVDHDDLEEEQF